VADGYKAIGADSGLLVYVTDRFLKSNAAALRAGLLSYSKGLEEANLFLKRFLSDPLAEGANHLPISEHLKADFRSIRPSTFDRYVDQLVAEVKRAQELQQQIDHF
jgi:hypothetical protein